MNIFWNNKNDVLDLNTVNTNDQIIMIKGENYIILYVF